jgi:hypothetical protein
MKALGVPMNRLFSACTVALFAFLAQYSSPFAKEKEDKERNFCKDLVVKKFEPNWFKCVILTKDAVKSICYQGYVNKDAFIRRIYDRAETPLLAMFGGKQPTAEDLIAFTSPSQENKEGSDGYDGLNLLLNQFQNSRFKSASFTFEGLASKPSMAAEDFLHKSEQKIKCGITEQKRTPPARDDAESSHDDAVKKNLDKLQKSVIIRQDVTELATKDLKKAKAAKVSYASDSVKKEDIYSLEGVAGVVIMGTATEKDSIREGKILRAETQKPNADWSQDWSYSLVPFVYSKIISGSEGGKKDFDVLKPGVQGIAKYVSSDGEWLFDVQADAAPVIDSKLKSELYTTGLRWSPTFNIGNHYLFRETHLIEPLAIAVDVAASARYSLVEEAGNNAELKGKDSFFGGGVDARLLITGWYGYPYLENLTFTLGYVYVNNSDGVQDIHRKSAVLSYSPSEAKNFTIDLSYVEGLDANTLVYEEKWDVSLGVRF